MLTAVRCHTAALAVLIAFTSPFTLKSALTNSNKRSECTFCSVLHKSMCERSKVGKYLVFVKILCLLLLYCGAIDEGNGRTSTVFQ
jgi:hypothetical protein